MRLYPLTEILDDGHIQVTHILESVQQQLDCQITIHDRSGILAATKTEPLLPQSRQHHHSFCAWQRTSRANWHAQCNQHCQKNMTTLTTPSIHHCWKGGKEVVVPIFRNDRLAMILFAGVFAGEHAPDPQSEPSWYRRWQALPTLTNERAYFLADILNMLGNQLLTIVDQGRKLKLPRAELIRQFIRDHACEDTCLQDLADHLGVSEGHCSHEVTRLLGQPYQELIKTERLRRAAILLRGERITVGEVAQLVGYESEYHFNRLFRKAYGAPPGKWRRSQR